jgi:hypothetical protein
MDKLTKLKLIKDGWKNVVFMSPAVEQLAEGRAKICATCPYAVEDSWLQAIGKLLKRMVGLKCELCGCPISAKTRSVDETCPHPQGPKW